MHWIWVFILRSWNIPPPPPAVKLLGRDQDNGAEVAKRGLHGVCREEAVSGPKPPAFLGATALHQGWEEGQRHRQEVLLPLLTGSSCSGLGTVVRGACV